ncbi:hypothetical protein BU24DRAFT_147658 [Aaosphaeria arxii CBS 175.79]|uniref:Uncharacterized protein n=1 Tax=Aaosphaeria arxii CBS 175.79 TaxID=1450172 RepID=A0A6A5XWJ7_9PLEO|nr:uncharacterized protein BU24DRAFT_147658 [Aaosphaeria arxii CBS 175.79]KAF2017293.1 hypothetical protein BU24DRAFT_147658 [Aaosphaeria arxii CBS 175.79]
MAWPPWYPLPFRYPSYGPGFLPALKRGWPMLCTQQQPQPSSRHHSIALLLLQSVFIEVLSSKSNLHASCIVRYFHFQAFFKPHCRLLHHARC